MKKLSKLTFLFTAAIMLAQVFVPTFSYAVNKESFLVESGYNTTNTANLKIQLERPYSDDDGDGTAGNDQYKIGNQYLIKIKDSNDTTNLNKWAYYCLRGGMGFGNIANLEDVAKSSPTYSYITDLIEKDTVKSKLTYLSDNSYKAICWIAENMYLPKSDNAAELKSNLLANANITNSVLTDDDIEVVQQIALWYFTNADKANELISSFVIPLDTNDSNNDPLALTYLTINESNYDNDSEKAFNYNRATQINKLYRYFVENAQDENYNIDEIPQEPVLTLEKESLIPTIEETTISGINAYLIGPFKVNKTEGNVDYTPKFTCIINDEEQSRVFETKNISPVALVNENGTVLTAQQAVSADKFYVRILNDVLDIDEVNGLKLDLSYEYHYYKTTATVWTAGNDDQPVLKVEKERITKEPTDSIIVIREIEPEKEFDLSLRKFITKTNETELTGDNDRTPEIYLDTLRKGTFNRKGTTEYTATYVHPKNPIYLKRGDKIIYTIRVYNEGQVDGYATEVTDYLCDDLEFIPASESTINRDNGWKQDKENGQIIRTSKLAGTLIKAYDPNMTEEEATRNNLIWQLAKDGTDGLYYADLKIECRIKNTANVNITLPNVAAITDDYNEEGIKDRDSKPEDLKDDEIRSYENNPWYEDDDDYERVIIEPDKVFDLSLRKYITKVERGENTIVEIASRTPEINTDALDAGTSKTAYYAHRKDPVEVEPGDIVTYNITIYNEGEQAGRATKVVDQLPTGLKFVEVVTGNYEVENYNEDTNKITLKEKTTNINLDAKDEGRPLNSTTIELKCEVVAPIGDEDQVLTNIAWILEEYNAETGTTITNQSKLDRDSEPYTAPETYTKDDLNTENIGYTGNDNKEDLTDRSYYYKGEQDDDDFEKVIIKTLNGSYDIVLVKEDAEGEQLQDTATFEVDGVEKQVRGRLTIVENKKVTPTNVNTVDTYIIKETVPPDKYCAFDGTIKIEVTKKKDGDRYVVDNIKYYVDDVEVTENRKDLDVYLNTDGNIYVEVKDYQFDLALRKFISNIERKGITIEFNSRVPAVDTSTLETGTTATYVHPKDALTVKQGDIITYTLRVYNEGQVDGYVEEITDYLPNGLGFLMGYEGNEDWLIDPQADVETKTIDGLEDITVVYGKDGADLKLTNGSLKDELVKQYGAEVKDGDKWQQSTNDKEKGLFYQEVEITCVVLAPNTYEGTLVNIAEISDDKAVNDSGTKLDVSDRDSEPDDVDLSDYELREENSRYQEDDDDYEPVVLKYFDLALRKFITGVNDEEVTSRIPEFKIDEEENYVYVHSKDPVYVIDKDTVTYTIRVFNEGTIAGYAEEVEDDIPEGLIFLPENDLNKEYRWVMYRLAEEDEDLEGKITILRNNKIYVETDDVEKATIIRTDYLSEANGTINEEGENSNLLKAFDKEAFLNEEIDSPDYRDVKIAFKVSQADIPEENTERIIINKAHITKDSDDDEDSIPDKWNEDEDDQDIEKIYVQEFDLALFKWVTKTIVTVNGKTTETETGFKPNTGLTEQSGENYRENSEAEPIASVVLDKKKLSKTVVKFVYNIKVINEGDIAGYATELTDYIPEGLEFIAEDNPLWTLGEKDGTITTRALETILLEPGQSATIEVVFTWKNSANNLGLKTNVVAITEDYNDKGVEDIDSTPGNENRVNYDKEQEDDDDFALVILTLKTGTEVTYIGLTFAIITILALGAITIKKYVL